ncbi:MULTISPECIES: helix-turn-helix transcriptional regulator [unclassified Lacrimispora]
MKVRLGLHGLFSGIGSQMSFPEYITAQRVGKATKLLENPDLSIMDVAMQSGFSSLPSFNRTFKQTNHCTPSQSRKMFDHFPG